MKVTVVKITIVGLVILALGIIGAFYIFQSKKAVSPLSSKPQSNEALNIEQIQPSETLKDYTDSAGFSFKYPEDVVVKSKDTSDPATYASIELTSNKIKGSMSMKVLDTKVKSVDDWFAENALTASATARKQIKMGEISGKEVAVNNKTIAAGLDQDILFTVEVDAQNQKYWTSVYNTILSSFTFVSQETNSTEVTTLDDSGSGDVLLEEETVE